MNIFSVYMRVGDVDFSVSHVCVHFDAFDAYTDFRIKVHDAISADEVCLHYVFMIIMSVLIKCVYTLHVVDVHIEWTYVHVCDMSMKNKYMLTLEMCAYCSH